jgi:ribosomal protein S17
MKKTRLHARVPEGMDLKEGDYVKVQECRPLSKILHFVVIKVTKKSEEAEK